MARALGLISRLLPLLATLVLLALVYYPAIGRDLWSDEAYTVSYTFHPSLAEVLNDVRKNEETPPLYFIATWAWSQAFGHGETAIRALSVLCGAASVALFASVAQRRLTQGEAAVATGVFLIAPLLQFYLLEARCYTMTLLLTIVCVEAFERLAEMPGRRLAQVAYGLSAGALFLTSYFSVVLLAAHWLLWLGRLRGAQWRQRAGAWAVAQAVAAACVVLWLPSLAYQIEASSVMTFMSVISPSTSATLAGSALMGYPLVQPLSVVWAVSAGAGWALALLTLRGLRQPARGAGLSLRTLWLPILLMVVFIAVTRAMHPRYTITLLPGLAIAVATGYSQLHRRAPLVAFTLLALLVAGMLTSRTLGLSLTTGRVWAQVAQIVEERAQPAEDAVLMLPPWDQRVFEYYYRGRELPILGAHHYDDFYYVQGHNFERSWMYDEAVAATSGYRRVWQIEDKRNLGLIDLDLPYRELERWQVGQVELKLYEVDEP